MFYKLRWEYQACSLGRCTHIILEAGPLLEKWFHGEGEIEAGTILVVAVRSVGSIRQAGSKS